MDPTTILAIVGGIESLVALYTKLRADAAQNAVMTADEWAALDARVAAALAGSAWQTDGQQKWQTDGQQKQTDGQQKS